MEMLGLYVRRVGARLAGFMVMWLRVTLAAAFLGGVGLAGQVPAQTLEGALRRMSDRAAVVFVGQVTAIRRVDGGVAASGVVEIEFRVDKAVRGCSVGVYVLREWAGLWAANDARYRVGQRRMMLLHAPGAGGLSSPVDGMDGAMPIRGVGTALQGIVGVPAGAGEMVDLRWVGAKLMQPVMYAKSPVKRGAGVKANLVAGSAAGVAVASTPTQAAGVEVVVGMLRSWNAAANVPVGQVSLAAR